jgi:membrane-associated phospholipid phosphatase
MKQIIRLFRPEEILGLFFGAILVILVWVYGDYQGFLQVEVIRIKAQAVAYFFLLSILVVFMRIAYGVKNILAVLRDWLPFFVCIFIYNLLHSFINVINPTDRHELLIKIDYFLFGVHPTVWLERFIHPSLTDYLSWVYLFYFLFLPYLAVVLYFKKKFFDFRNLILTSVVCFYAGYSGYLMVPALGPWITQENLYSVNLDGSVAEGILFPFIETSSILRDSFPSLHTAVMTIVLVFAYRYESKVFWLMLPFGLSLFISTVYLRQHYVIDLIAGWLLAALCIYLVPRFHAFWEEHVRNISEEMKNYHKVK